MGANPGKNIDRYIGHKIKWLRRDKHLTAKDIAAGIGMKIALYKQSEEGQRRLRSCELVEISNVLNVPISSFFPQGEDIEYTASSRIDPAAVQPSEAELQDLFHFFTGIDDPIVRTHILQLIRSASQFKA